MRRLIWIASLAAPALLAGSFYGTSGSEGDSLPSRVAVASGEEPRAESALVETPQPTEPSPDEPVVYATEQAPEPKEAESSEAPEVSRESAATEETVLAPAPFQGTYIEARGPFGGTFGFGLATSPEPIDADEFPLATPQVERDCDRESIMCSAWAKVPVGSWARWRATTTGWENGRPARSVTETRACLKSVDRATGRYELQFDSTIKMGSVDFSSKSETITYDFWDVPVDESARAENLAPVNLRIGLRTIPCRTRRVVRETPKYRETTTIWYSTVVAPYIFQRETIRESKTDAPSSRELYVVQKIPPRIALGAAANNYVARSGSVEGASSSSKTLALAPTVPGLTIRETSDETAREPRADSEPVVYRTEVALVDYYVPR